MSTDFSCCDFGTCNQGIGCPAGSVVAEKLLAGVELPELAPIERDWRRAREAMSARQQQAWERAQAQWFKPLYNTPEPEPEKKILTPLRVLIWCGAALAACVARFSTLLYFFR